MALISLGFFSALFSTENSTVNLGRYSDYHSFFKSTFLSRRGQLINGLNRVLPIIRGGECTDDSLRIDSHHRIVFLIGEKN